MHSFIGIASLRDSALWFSFLGFHFVILDSGSLCSIVVSNTMTTPTNNPSIVCRQFADQDNTKDQVPGFGDTDHWRFTPSMLDSTSFAFSSFANQQSGDFTPTSSSMSAFLHNQAGDLHTPGMAFQLGTPLSSDDSHPMSAVDINAYHPHLLHNHTFPATDDYQQQSFAPSSFMHQDSGYDTMEQVNDLPDHKDDRRDELHEQTNFMGATAYESMPAPQIPSMDKYALPTTVLRRNFTELVLPRFRYHVTFNAPTAMVKHAAEIPITYLNKGQAYAVNITDKMASGPAAGPVRYRTVIRISFEDEEQRQKPSACWQLWKEGRGLAESHQRGGKLQAVEYVDPNQGGNTETRRSRVELEMASFDCFSVSWSPTPGSASADCSVAVRFNFLSTDFSHSKGVKGIPVRLCAKTEIISSGTPDSPPGSTAEVCFCKVKLFRDHGAERKLSNDVAHIKKTIDKLQQQITQVENGAKDVGKRKRTGSSPTKGGSHRPGKVQKHKRTWSVSSQGSGDRPAVDDDLHMKLATMQDMFSSTRPVSVLYLRGYEQDDPDVFPVALPGETRELSRISSLDRRVSWDRKKSGETTPTNSIISPAPSSRSVSGTKPQEQSTFEKPAAYTAPHQTPDDWDHLTHFSDPNFSDPNFSGLSDAAIKVTKNHADSTMPTWIEALGVDPSYKAPPERPIKPIACFYILIKVPGDKPENDYYKAVYLMERTVKDLITSIATKCGVEPKQVIRTLRINPKGLKIMVDDDVVRELPEGQDMIVEFSEVEASSSVKQELGTGDTTPNADTPTAKRPQDRVLEMRLRF